MEWGMILVFLLDRAKIQCKNIPPVFLKTQPDVEQTPAYFFQKQAGV